MGDELRRRLVHVSGTAFPGAYLAGLVSWETLRAVLVAGTALAFVLEALRLSGRADWAVYDQLTREYERENLAGYALYAVGMTAAALAFEPRVAVPAMLMLTVADPISGLLGSGGLAKQGWVLLLTFGVCMAIASWFVPPVTAAVGAAVAAVADGMKPVVRGYVIDDNLTIPIGAAVAMFLALQYLPKAAAATAAAT